MLRALCLDLMDTLLVDPYREAITAATGMDPAALADVRDPTAWPEFELGLIDEAEFARRFFAAGDGGRRFDLEAFTRTRRAGYRFVEGMESLLEVTGGRLERYVATNYPVWVTEVAETFALDVRTEGILASHTLGVRKPDVAFFERMLERIGHAPGDCLFVDDRPANCAAAERVGMRAHTFAGAEDLRRRLAAEGVMLPAAS